MNPRNRLATAALIGGALVAALGAARAEPLLATPALYDRAWSAAGAFVRSDSLGNRARAVDDALRDWDQMLALGVYEGLHPEAVVPDPRSSELDRFDKQIGGSASSLGTTSLAEKPGIPQWLALAFEKGALTADTSGSSLTLSTSASALSTALFADALTGGVGSPWDDVGASASFPLTSSGEVPSDFDRPREWSARWKLLGGRATMTRAFDHEWRDSLREALSRRGGAQVHLEGTVGDTCPWFGDLSDETKALARQRLNSLVVDAEAGHADKVEMVANQLISVVQARVVARVRSGLLPVNPGARSAIDQAVDAVQGAQAAWNAARESARRRIEERTKSQVLTLEITDHSVGGGQDWSEGKLLYLFNRNGVDVTLNAGISFFRNRRAVLSQEENLRASSLAGLLEWKRRNPLRRSPNDPGFFPMSVGLRLEFPNDSSDQVAVFQVKAEIPLGAAVSVPISMTWANRTELVEEAKVRAHFGFSVDTDKLFALAGLHAVAPTGR
ncbi:MAG TPA: hypothetical protein VGK93_13090 [Candidatus Eisenbacteria bacterium]